MNRIVVPIAAAILSAAASAVSAQEPPSPRAAPDAGAVAQENRDIAGRWLGATDAAIQSAGKAGGTLTNIVTGKFEGLSKSISIADAASTLGAASALDVRGTVSGAAAIAVGGKVTAGGAALFGEIGAVTGGAVGSFFPVIGNIAGTMVGGAIGTAAGGFIAAFGYDKYVKDYVAMGVTGIASVFDTAPLDQAMQAKRQFLWDTMAPEERAKLQGFNPEEVKLLDFGTLPYVVVPKQPTPGDQQQDQIEAIDPIFAGAKQLALAVWHPQYPDYVVRTTCRIDGTSLQCHGTKVDGNSHNDIRYAGQFSGTQAQGEQIQTDTLTLKNCSTRTVWTSPLRYQFLAAGQLRVQVGPYRGQAFAGTCGGPSPTLEPVPGQSLVGTWEVVQ